jgi:hypothetical protein
VCSDKTWMQRGPLGALSVQGWCGRGRGRRRCMRLGGEGAWRAAAAVVALWGGAKGPAPQGKAGLLPPLLGPAAAAVARGGVVGNGWRTLQAEPGPCEQGGRPRGGQQQQARGEGSSEGGEAAAGGGRGGPRGRAARLSAAPRVVLGGRRHNQQAGSKEPRKKALRPSRLGAEGRRKSKSPRQQGSAGAGGEGWGGAGAARLWFWGRGRPGRAGRRARRPAVQARRLCEGTAAPAPGRAGACCCGRWPRDAGRVQCLWRARR